MVDGNTYVNIKNSIYTRRSPVNICNHSKSYIYPNNSLNCNTTSENRDKLDKVLYGNKLDHYIIVSNETYKYRD